MLILSHFSKKWSKEYIFFIKDGEYIMKDSIKIVCDSGEKFDKMQLALAIKNSTFNDEMSCSLIENKILKNCSTCQLKIICDEIDEVAEKYIEKTTTVVKSFNFY